MRSKTAFALIPALVILAGCDFDEIGGSGRYQEDFHYTYPLKTGGRLAVDSFNGAIEVSPWDEETVDISGTKYARTQDDAADIRIDIDHSTREAVSIRATRPMTRNGNHGVRFVIKAPRSVVLDRLATSNGAIRATDGVGPGQFKTSNGGVHVLGFRGDLSVETSNGTLELNDVEGLITGHTSNGAIRGERIRGGADLATSNGGIRLAFDQANGAIKLGSNNGGIELTLPAGATVPVRAHTSNSSITLRLPGGEVNARLMASTSNGSVTSEIEMRTRGEISRHHLEATMGNGGPLIDLSTSNGSIRIVR